MISQSMHGDAQSQPGVVDDNATVRSRLHDMWSAVAGSWAEHADYTDARHAAETAALLRLTATRQGDRVLELACGPGGLGLAAAERVAPWGDVVMSDVAREMSAIAATRARARGVENATVLNLDLERIDQPDATFSVVLCRHGLQFTLDPVVAAREIARVLRPNGRFAVSVWGPRRSNPWLAAVLDVVSTHLGRQVPPHGMPGPFALSDPDQLGEVLRAGGLVDLKMSEVAVPLIATSFDDWWTRTSGLAGPLSKILTSMDAVGRVAIREDARAAIARFESRSGGYQVPGLAIVASGHRAGGPVDNAGEV